MIPFENLRLYEYIQGKEKDREGPGIKKGPNDRRTGTSEKGLWIKTIIPQLEILTERKNEK